MHQNYRISDGTPGGLVTEIDGYMCFIEPIHKDGVIGWKWTIQSGGGWTHRGGADVFTHGVGVAFSGADAESQILDALNLLD